MVVLSGAVPWCGSPKSDFKPRKMMKNPGKIMGNMVGNGILMDFQSVFFWELDGIRDLIDGF